ncbi:MAG: hypothetical protein RIQ33_771 [Bacteroidota bacterium]|jgi:hypothetical protein
MVAILKSNTSITAFQELLSKVKSKKKFNANKYLGKIKFSKSAIEIQKEMRNEWK